MEGTEVNAHTVDLGTVLDIYCQLQAPALLLAGEEAWVPSGWDAARIGNKK
jgi:hypothetical protein